LVPLVELCCWLVAAEHADPAKAVKYARAFFNLLDNTPED
jgi:hypothetical protein